MTKTAIDVRGLAAAMEMRVKAEGISWRAAAGQIGVSPSLLTRLRNGQRPDLEAFAAMTQWLNEPADRFFLGVESTEDSAQEPLTHSMNALLRARRDLNDTDREFLSEILLAGLKHLRQRPADESG
ncbi:transcriptional regulator [Rhodococcoides fascians]|uniref:transcriptional regulator n=1 Tax=Rhodococcoides fascians TaxID=1828 RepID=UPI0005628D8D|nr:transcriptional regulator [Rhodococcus fascians]